MKLDEVLTAVKNRQLTCSMGAQLLVEQPTKGEESHAHMHTLDGFKVDVTKIKPEGFKRPDGSFAFTSATPEFHRVVQEHTKIWENPELHLNPKTSPQHTAQLYKASTDQTKFQVEEYYLDRRRLAVNDTYLKRGMAEIKEKHEVTYSQQLIYTDSGGKKTNKVFPLTSKTDKAVLPQGATLFKDLGVKETVTKVHPNFLAMEKHTMFEDSEVLVMATTAVLVSDAGLLGLSKLETEGAGHYVAVHSASAVKAVEEKFKKHKPSQPALKLVERSPQAVQVDTSSGQPQVVTTGAQYDLVDMKRVVLVVKKDASNELIVVTCYPSQAHPTINPPPGPDEDVVELDKATGAVRILRQVGAIELKW